MSGKTGQSHETKRQDRLKAALKSNMAKRKAQARARAEKDPDDKSDGQSGKDAQDG